MAQRDEGVRDFFRAWSETYDTPFYQDGLYKPLHAALAARVEPLARAGRLGLVVDVGTGTGRSLEWLPRFARSVVALDFSADMLRRARGRITEGSLLVRGTAVTLPLADETVDLALSCFSMHWWPDIPAGWAELRRVLKPSCHALVLVPSAALLALPSMRRMWGGAALVQWLPPAQYARMARAAGFDVGLPRQVLAGAYLLDARRPPT